MRAFLSFAAALALAIGALASLGCSSNSPAPPSPSTPPPAGGGGGGNPGTPLTTWSASYGAPHQTQESYSLAVDRTTNDFVIAGALEGTVDFGGGPLTSAGGSDVFVAKYDAVGHHLWSARFGDASDQEAHAVAVDASGNVIVVGSFEGTLDFRNPRAGILPLASEGGRDIFIAKLGPSGTPVYARGFGGLSEDDGASVAVGADGAATLAGTAGSPLSITGVHTTRAAPAPTKGVVIRLTPLGDTDWIDDFGGTGPAHLTSVATDANDDLLVTGTFQGNASFGVDGATLVGTGQVDVVVASLDDEGAVRWQTRSSSPKIPDTAYLDDQAIAVAYDREGNALALGNYSGFPDLGGGPLPNAGGAGGGYDIYLSKYDPQGKYLWATHFGSIDFYDEGDALAIGPADEIYVAGHVRSTIPFGLCQLHAGAVQGTLVVGLVNPNGVPLCGMAAGSGALAQAHGIVVDTVGRLGLTGSFDGSVDLGTGVMTAAGLRDAFLARESSFADPSLRRAPLAGEEIR